MCSAPHDDVVEVEIWIAASPAAIFPYLTDARRLVRWIGLVATLEPEPGGMLRIDVNGASVASGEVLEVVPHRRVVWSWGWEGAGHGVPPGSTTVTIELEPERGGTRLTLTHAGLRGDQRPKHAQGWTHYAARLRTVAEGRDPGPDPLAAREVSHG